MNEIVTVGIRGAGLSQLLKLDGAFGSGDWRLSAKIHPFTLT